MGFESRLETKVGEEDTEPCNSPKNCHSRCKITECLRTPRSCIEVCKSTEQGGDRETDVGDSKTVCRQKKFRGMSINGKAVKRTLQEYNQFPAKASGTSLTEAM